MTFTYYCTTIVLVAFIMAVGYKLGEMSNDCDYLAGWIFSSIGFVVCLTELLVSQGII